MFEGIVENFQMNSCDYGCNAYINIFQIPKKDSTKMMTAHLPNKAKLILLIAFFSSKGNNPFSENITLTLSTVC